MKNTDSILESLARLVSSESLDAVADMVAAMGLEITVIEPQHAF